MARGQKPRTPQAIVQRLIIRPTGPKGGEHNISRQVAVFAAQPITQPRTDARPPGQLMAGLAKGDRRIVVDRLGMHRTDHRQLVGLFGQVRQQFAELHAALAVPPELKNGGCHRKLLLAGGHRGEPLTFPDRIRQILTAPIGNRRFGIKQIHLRRCPGLEQVNDPLRLGRVRGKPRQAARRGLRLRQSGQS